VSEVLLRVERPHGGFEIRETAMGDVECWTIADDGAEDFHVSMCDDEREVVLDLVAEVVRLRTALDATIDERAEWKLRFEEAQENSGP
jgi:hypothetical protein